MKKWVLILSLWLLSPLLFAEPLQGSEVFQMTTKLLNPNTFVIQWQIKPGYFLYADRIKIKEQDTDNTHLGRIQFPEPTKKIDKQGHSFLVYRDQLTVSVSVLGEQAGEDLVQIHYQGCADDGFCYPPAVQTVKLTIDQQGALSAVNLELPTAESPLAKTNIEDDFEAVFINRHWFMVILSFLGFGLLLSLTPCVLPMIPVLSGIIVGHGENLSPKKAFLLSLSYVLSMSFTYALVGAIVAKLGSNLQILMQTPAAIGFFSFVFVLLALSMFGFYELKLPVSWQSKLANISRNQASGHYVGAAIMGCLSTLILSPCVTAPLIGALGYIAHSGNIALGSIALFFLGIGMGVPLLLVGFSAGKWLPKAGKWMNAVKAFFGVLLLAVAIYLLDRILPSTLIMILWASLLIFCGIYCGAFVPSLSHREKFHQGLGLLLFTYGMLVLIGASMGETNPLQPLAGFGFKQAISKPSAHETVNTLGKLQKAISEAKGKPLLLDFYADWCSSCKVMEATVFQDPRIQEALQSFVVLKVDVTKNSTEEKELLNQFKVVAPPTFLFLNAEGKEHARFVGETSAQKFLKRIEEAAREK